jgi:small subunit ribosomal protein S17e
VDRIKRLSILVLEKHKDKFTTNFAENKKTLDQLVVVRSKGLKNEVAGYITKLLKREVDTKTTTEQEDQEDQEVEQVEAQEEAQEEESSEDSTPQEILVENQSQESS